MIIKKKKKKEFFELSSGKISYFYYLYYHFIPRTKQSYYHWLRVRLFWGNSALRSVTLNTETGCCWPSFYPSDDQPSSPDFFKNLFHSSLSWQETFLASSWSHWTQFLSFCGRKLSKPTLDSIALKLQVLRKSWQQPEVCPVVPWGIASGQVVLFSLRIIFRYKKSCHNSC